MNKSKTILIFSIALGIGMVVGYVLLKTSDSNQKKGKDIEKYDEDVEDRTVSDYVVEDEEFF